MLIFLLYHTILLPSSKISLTSQFLHFTILIPFSTICANSNNKSEIEDVLSEFGYEFKDIRRIFDSRNFWIKDTTTAGYQFTKKIDGKNIRFYKLRKISMESKVAVTTDLCVAFTDK